MAGVAKPNYKTFYQGASGQRGSGDVFGTTDWTGGVNKGGSCAPGVGINTGDYSPKASDWSQAERDPQNSQALGQVVGPIVTEPDGSNDQASFVQAIADTADDAQVGTTGVFNRTGKTVPNGAWFWGHKPIA